MRVIAILVAAMFLIPTVSVGKAASDGAAAQATDLSAAKKKKPAKKSKEENLKAAPGTGPSGPATKY